MIDDIVAAFHWFRDALYNLLKFYQGIIEPVLGEQSYWVAIVMLTLTIRIILIPLVAKTVRSQRAMAELAPELKKLQAKYKDDRQKLNQEMMALYQERGVNPMAGCLPILVQAPFFLALYHVMFQREVAGERNLLIDHSFFGIPLDTIWWRLDGWGERLLTVEGFVILVLILAQGAVMYLSMRQMMAKQSTAAAANPQAQQMQGMMLRIMPVMLIVVGVNFPLAVLIYWVTTNLWQWGQQTVMLRIHPIKTPDAEGEKADSTAKPGKQEQPAERKGLLATFRALADSAQQRNGSSGATGSKGGSRDQTRDQTKDGTREGAEAATTGADGSAPGGGKKGTGAPRRRRSADSPRKTTSSPRSGGGKGGAGSRQRRRKR